MLLIYCTYLFTYLFIIMAAPHTHNRICLRNILQKHRRNKYRPYMYTLYSTVRVVQCTVLSVYCTTHSLLFDHALSTYSTSLSSLPLNY